MDPLPGASCCECPTFSDNFNRDEIGPLWSVRRGTWSIEQGTTLKQSANADALIRYEYHFCKPRMCVFAHTINEAASKVYRLILNYKNDNNYLYAEFGLGSNPPDTSYVSLHVVSGGGVTEIDRRCPMVSPDARTFGACVGDNVFAAWISGDGASFCVWANQGSVFPDGYQAGLGTNTAGILFDDFGLTGHLDDHPECPTDCTCRCDGHALGHTLLATYQGQGDCDTLDGITCELTSGGDSAQWEGVIEAPHCLEGVAMSLHCGVEDDVTSWQLHVDPSGAENGRGCMPAGYLSADEDSTCNPLNLMFHYSVQNSTNQSCPDDCLPCGRQGPALPPPYYYTQFDIIVTEA